MIPEGWDAFPAWEELPLEERRRRLEPIEEFLADLAWVRLLGALESIERGRRGPEMRLLRALYAQAA